MTSLNTARKRKDTPRLYRIVENDFATTVAPNGIYRLYERIGSTQIVLLVQSFKETLQYCDEWRNSHQSVSQ